MDDENKHGQLAISHSDTSPHIIKQHRWPTARKWSPPTTRMPDSPHVMLVLFLLDASYCQHQKRTFS